MKKNVIYAIIFLVLGFVLGCEKMEKENPVKEELDFEGIAQVANVHNECLGIINNEAIFSDSNELLQFIDNRFFKSQKSANQDENPFNEEEFLKFLKMFTDADFNYDAFMNEFVEENIISSAQMKKMDDIKEILDDYSNLDFDCINKILDEIFDEISRVEAIVISDQGLALEEKTGVLIFSAVSKASLTFWSDYFENNNDKWIGWLATAAFLAIIDAAAAVSYHANNNCSWWLAGLAGAAASGLAFVGATL